MGPMECRAIAKIGKPPLQLQMQLVNLDIISEALVRSFEKDSNFSYL